MTQNNRNILSRRSVSCLSIIFDRPRVINSLNEAMIDSIEALLDEAENDESCSFVVFYSTSPRGFCAGGDVKELARLAGEGRFDQVDSFFSKEYAMDLRIHRFPKPVVAVADGITMGGGLGIAAGADICIATPATQMAMPETIIGFFPDVGATGWMFSICPKGYPEYLGLTGYGMTGSECVRLGFATHLVPAGDIPELIRQLENISAGSATGRRELAGRLKQKISVFAVTDIPSNHVLDEWVKTYFDGRDDLREILASLAECHGRQEYCGEVFKSIAQRSPTALVLTLKLLRHNEGRSLEDVFASEFRAARYISRHPDYREGIRARLVDRDDNPQWRPPELDLVDLSDFTP
jgi:enoyl-CoA hydratase/carnithine racemase